MTQLDSIYWEDFDRPWDYDHILPFHYTSGRHHMPPIIKDLQDSIGNLRAWPMEINRSYQKDMPCQKLECPDDEEGIERRYELWSGNEIRSASLIDERNWHDWKDACPKEEHPQYLALVWPDDRYKTCREALTRAITARCAAIYRRWFETLRVGELFERPSYADPQHPPAL